MRPIIKQLWSSLVASAREEERNRAAFLNGDNAAGKDARAFGFASFIVDVTMEAQDRHGGAVPTVCSCARIVFRAGRGVLNFADGTSPSRF
jgi:hypothetical protein